MPSEEYLIKWIHRLVAMTTGMLIIATSISVWMNKKADRKIKFASTFAATLVVTQITLGALVIDLKLHAILVAATWHRHSFVCHGFIDHLVCVRNHQILSGH